MRFQHPARAASSAGTWFALSLMAGYAGLLCWAVWQLHLPGWVLPGSALLNGVTFLVYGMDKYAAQKQRWRTPEAHLHALSLAGGWGGAWLAQRVLRHKVSKASFMGGYWLTVVVHCAGVGVWLWQKVI